ncbi:MAG: hypothetical protein Q9160_000615 [Pyrenula sp. 1 TL-2023]
MSSTSQNSSVGQFKILEPRILGLPGQKALRTLVYNNLNTTKYRWGSQVQVSEPKHEWFKLLLDPNRSGGNSDLARKYPSRLPAPSGEVDVAKLVTDYLSALRNHMEKILERRLPRAARERISKEYILTVPEMWSEKARNDTLSCATSSGMGNKDSIHIISEPEAAALYELNERSNFGIEVDDTFVVCDAGGGTVDLISYTVKSLKPTVLEEAAPGSGSACGSTFLNRIFADYLKSRFGGNPKWNDKILWGAMEQFDNIKRQFDGRSGPYRIPVAPLEDDKLKGINRGELRLDKDEIKKIFEPVIKEIVKLVQSQISDAGRAIEAVLLIGGFGQNVYLQDRLKEAVGDQINVYESMNPWTAVMRGAVIRGLEELSPTLATIRIPSRRARKHIGIEGDVVNESKPYQIHFYWEQRKSQGRPNIIRMTIFQCLDRQAPLYKLDGVRDLAEVKANLTSIPEAEIDQEPGADDQVYYKVNLDIEMTCFSAWTVFALLYKGKRYDTVTAAFV